jgi:BNR repeat-containing family member
LDSRTNLYYLASSDGAKTWRTAGGTAVTLPVSSSKTPALVRDYAAEKKLVYLKDLTFDAAGRSVILYLTSKDHKPGPAGGPHEWHTARWDGTAWRFRPVTTSDHNYDHGSLSVEADGTWRIIAPFGPGPQPFGTGGEMQMWTSTDRGETWAKVRDLTTGSSRNHTYARRPRNAHPDVYALWADGDARKKSDSDLYVCTKAGDVFRLPRSMTGETAPAERVK